MTALGKLGLLLEAGDMFTNIELNLVTVQHYINYS